jgi:hypothetical protein
LVRVRLLYLLLPKGFDPCEISSSHGGEYDVQSCLLGYLHGSITQKTALNIGFDPFIRKINPTHALIYITLQYFPPSPPSSAKWSLSFRVFSQTFVSIFTAIRKKYRPTVVFQL